jgi:hypothetical protein
MCFIFPFSNTQASEALPSLSFRFSQGGPTHEIFVNTPKNWKNIENVAEPVSYKFIHESGDRECYLAFKCYRFQPDRREIFLTSWDLVKALSFYEEGDEDLLPNMECYADDFHALIRFDTVKNNKAEHVFIHSYLANPKKYNCINTIIFISKKSNSFQAVDDNFEFNKNIVYISRE